MKQAIFFLYAIIGIVVVAEEIVEKPHNASSEYRDYVLNSVFGAGEFDDENKIEPDPPTFREFYRQGIDAYLSNDWEGCIYFIEKALINYHEYFDIVARCRILCESERYNKKPLFPEDPDHLHFYEGVLRKTLCLKKCQLRELSGYPLFFQADGWTKKQFKSRVPYEYLQMCYHKTDDMRKAVGAVYTVLSVRPKDHLSNTNLKFYSNQPEFEDNMLVDMEERKFVPLYISGIAAYDKEQWQTAVNDLEKSLELFIEENENCRALCEDGFNQGWYPDFTSSTANHFVYCLRCKLNCTRVMAQVRTEEYNDVFASHYEYMQLSYFKLNNMEMACRMTKTYLIFYPKNAMMQENLEYYEKNLPNGTDCSQPRIEAVKYFHRIRYEYNLIKFIDDEFIKLQYL